MRIYYWSNLQTRFESSNFRQGQTRSCLSRRQVLGQRIEQKTRYTSWNAHGSCPSNSRLHVRPLSQKCPSWGREQRPTEQWIPPRFILAPTIWFDQWSEMAFIRTCLPMGCLWSKEDQGRSSSCPSPKIKWNLSQHASWPLPFARSSRICPPLSH